MHALYQCLSPTHPIRLVTTVVPFYRWETEAGKVKHVACTQDLHPDQPGSKASALASEVTLPPTYSPLMGIRDF